MSPLAQIIVAALAEPEVRKALQEALAPDGEDLLTVAAAAEVAKVTVRVIRNENRKRRITLLGPRRQLVSRAELARWLENRPARVDDDGAVDRAAARLARGKAA
jgi:hypothetical protein